MCTTVSPLENLLTWFFVVAAPVLLLPFAAAAYARREGGRRGAFVAAGVALLATAFAWTTRPLAGSVAPLVLIQRWLFVAPAALAVAWALSGAWHRARAAAWGASFAVALLAAVTLAMALDVRGACA